MYCDNSNLNRLIENIENISSRYDLPDSFLLDKGLSTRYDIGIGEYSYGITVIPCEWVLPYLKKLQEVEKYIKSLEETKDFIKTDKSGYSDDKIKLLEDEISKLKDIIEKGD